MNTLSNEANALAYQTGVKALGPLVQRIIDLGRASCSCRSCFLFPRHKREMVH